MNKRFVSFLSGVLALLTVVGGLDLAGFITLLPVNVAKVFAIGLPLMAGIKHLVIDLGDFADDGQINGSFKLLPFLLILGAVSFLSLTSCSGVMSGLTGAPIPATPVKRDGGKEFNVATADIYRAEGMPPGAVFGLYNAGLVAQGVAQVRDSGK